jgi:UDP-N-acetylglucosamine pyrophosphorylase
MINSPILENSEDNLDVQILILAAGHGSRMESELPKVMHQVGGKPMLERVLYNALNVTNDIILVYSEKLFKFLEHYKQLCKLALQENPQGTAHAVAAANSELSHSKIIVVIYGDNPLITADIIKDLIDHLRKTKSSVVTLAFNRENPGQYGRIITDSADNFLKITEFKDASETEKKIQLCNSGIMAFAPEILEKYLSDCLISDVSEELYLTKIIDVCVKNKELATYYLSKNSDLVIGVNTQEELEQAAIILQNQTL